MSEATPDDGLRGRLTRQGEDALGKLAEDLLENPLINGAISRVFEAREKASQAQEVAMKSLNLPAASDLERLTRRLRSVSQRLEGAEEALDRVEQAVDRVDRRLRELAEDAEVGAHLDRLDERLEALIRELGSVRDSVGDEPAVSRSQERLEVGDART